MLARTLWMLPFVSMAVAQPPGLTQAEQDLKTLQGTWVMAALEVNGQDVGVAKVEGTTLTIKGDRYSVKVKGKDRGCVVRLGPKQDPPAFDMIFTEPGGAERTYKGIYKIDGDAFRVCRGLNADQDRPRQLATWPGTNYFVVTWKRQP